MIDLEDEKKRIRKNMREQLKALSPEQRDEWSQQITERLLMLPEYHRARTIMLFLSFSTEYDTDPLIRHALSAGKTVCAPRVDWTTWRMLPVAMTAADQFVKDDHGIKEPTGDQIIAPDTIDLVLMPGLAFDLAGHRLGRGGGFYDRFLSQADLRHALRLAAVFDLQILDSVPHDELDQPVDMIVTPTKFHRLLHRSST